MTQPPQEMIASLSIEIRLMANGEVEVVIPDDDDGEYARVRAGDTLRALDQATQYVDCVLYEMAEGCAPPSGDGEDG